MPEFVGRLSAFAYMKPLGVDEIKTIITKAKNTALTKYQEYFRVHDCELILTSHAIDEIAKVVANQGLGARYINVMLDAVLQDHTFHAPEYSGKTISITAEDILRTKL
jgi:ATP-dependent protease Clp ATPase subunit